MKKKLLCTMMAVVMSVMMVTGCGSSAEETTEEAAVEETAEEAEEATEETTEEASGEVGNCQQICDVFANSNVDLVLAIATPAAQSAVNVFQETEVPVLFTAVTDAVGAGLVDSNEAPGKNVTGTLDMPVIADQIAVIKDVLPEAQAAAEELGMTVEVITASTSNDIPQVISTAAINYYELGKQTAEMAVRVLEGESASAVVVETQKECALVVNKTFAESVGVEIPAEMLETAATVY